VISKIRVKPGTDRSRGLDADMDELRSLQDRLWAERRRSLLIVLQGTDASGKEQGERLQARVDDPAKRWKFRAEDLEDRRRFGAIEAAYEEAITETSTRWAPWHVVPADRRWVRNAAVTRLLLATLRELRPAFPEPSVDLSGFAVD
jgi:polyphosphate kinase 2 (PPK2 family)